MNDTSFTVATRVAEKTCNLIQRHLARHGYPCTQLTRYEDNGFGFRITRPPNSTWYLKTIPETVLLDLIIYGKFGHLIIKCTAHPLVADQIRHLLQSLFKIVKSSLDEHPNLNARTEVEFKLH